MSFEYLAAVRPVQNITSPGKFILFILANGADQDGNFHPSVRYLAESTCLDERTVRRHLVSLRDAGHIEIIPRARPNGGTSANEYRLTVLDKPVTLEAPRAARPPLAVDPPPPPGTAPTPPGQTARGPLAHDQGHSIEPCVEPLLEPTPLPPASGGSVLSPEDRKEARKALAAVLAAAKAPAARQAAPVDEEKRLAFLDQQRRAILASGQPMTNAQFSGIAHAMTFEEHVAAAARRQPGFQKLGAAVAERR